MFTLRKTKKIAKFDGLEPQRKNCGTRNRPEEFRDSAPGIDIRPRHAHVQELKLISNDLYMKKRESSQNITPFWRFLEHCCKLVKPRFQGLSP